jgi:leucyl-tRNA synthetase
VTVVVQVNGKKRGDVLVAPDADEAQVTELALRDANVQQHLAGKSIRKSVFVKGRLLNLVVG